MTLPNEYARLVESQGGWFQVNSIELAAALLTFGFPKRKAPVTRQISAVSGESVSYWIQSKKKSATGYDFTECWKGWHSPKLAPDSHPVRWLRQYAEIHLHMIRAAKAAPEISALETQRRGNSKNLVSTSNTKLAAALKCLGFPPDERMPVSKSDVAGRSQSTFWFPVSDTNRPELLKLLGAWNRFAEFEAKNPEHALCYIRAYGENREQLIRDYDGANPQYLIPKGSRWLLVTDGLPKSVKRELEKLA